MAKNQRTAEQRFIERMGQQAQSDGLSRIAGQIWAALVLADEPLGSMQLVEMLQISKGSVSTNVRILELLNIVERRSVPGERQDYFAIRENPYLALVEGQIKRFENAQAIVAEAKSSVASKRARQKLADLDLFYKLYRESCVSLHGTLKSTPSASRRRS